MTESVFDSNTVLIAAEEQTDGRLILRTTSIVTAEIKIHFTAIRV
jgi:hypothetical protein